jgi:hypothetical protein
MSYNLSYHVSGAQVSLEALAASVVKVAGRDVLATWKVLISLVMTPALYVFYATVATIVAVKADLPSNWILWTPFLVWLALPCIGYAALKFGEAGMDVLKLVSLCKEFRLASLVASQITGPSHHCSHPWKTSVLGTLEASSARVG